MIIVAFSKTTSKVLPRIVCRKFRHAALITTSADNAHTLVLHQFVRRGRIVQIKLMRRDLSLLRANGWTFIYLTGDARDEYSARGAITCVGYVKRRLNIHRPLVQTPTQLYNYLK